MVVYEPFWDKNETIFPFILGYKKIMPISNTQYLRNKLLRPVFLPEHPHLLVISEWDRDFEDLMRHRLKMGAFRYGQMKDKEEYEVHSDYIEEVQKRIEVYQRTGNVEALADAANLLLLEYRMGHHPKKHFASEDDTKFHCE
jgi:hypothetical protein